MTGVFLLCMAVVVGSSGAVNMFKLSQGSDPTKMTITWSSVNTQNQQSQCKFGTDTSMTSVSQHVLFCIGKHGLHVHLNSSLCPSPNVLIVL